MTQSLFTLFALQLARIQNTLHPATNLVSHVSGPKKPDLQEQETLAMKKAAHGGD